MQRATTPESAATSVMPPGVDTACPVCGDPVRGIATPRPGEHRFVGCDHYASARFLRHRADVPGMEGPRRRIGP